MFSKGVSVCVCVIVVFSMVCLCKVCLRVIAVFSMVCLCVIVALQQPPETTPHTSVETASDTSLAIALGVALPVVTVVIASVIIGCLLCKKKKLGPWKAGCETHADQPSGTQVQEHQEPVQTPAQTSNE